MPTTRTKPRWLVCALLSARIKDPDQMIKTMENFLISRGDQVVARMVQRRGVSRGGTKLMDQPLTQRTLFSPGKTQELAALAESAEASHLLIFNSITPGQRRALAELTGAEVHSFSDDSAFSAVASLYQCRPTITNGEQPGAGQPTTRPVFEPEGGDKPQPEAEGRSR